MTQNKNTPNPQNQDPQPQAGWTPGQKLAAGGMIAGALVAGIKADPNSVTTSPSVERGKPAITLVQKAPEPFANSVKLSDGRIATFSDPQDNVIKLAENGTGSLGATTKYGNRVAFDLPVPTPGIQEQGSPQQAADPNASMEFIPALDKNPYTNDITSPVTLAEDGHGGLTAERMGEPVTGVVHVNLNSRASFTQLTPPKDAG